MPPSPDLTDEPAAEERLFGRTFWLAYLANSALMVSVSVLFRYGDFVSFLGGTEGDLGLIVGIGTVGAIVARVFQGAGIDRYGPRRIWLISLALVALSTLAHVLVGRVDGLAVYAARMVLATGIAGSFGASITYISLRAPPHRVAEILGMIGTSGFLGMAIGPVLGDLLFRGIEPTGPEVRRMFLVAAGAAGVAWLAAAAATRGDLVRRPRRQPPMWGVLRRYHPGVMLLVSLAMGIGIGLPHVFLRPFCAEIGVSGIRSFFLVYAGTAFVVRVLTRRWSERLGVYRVVLLGMIFLAASMWMYLLVESAWQLAFPAMVAATAHALLFPAVVAGGSLSFPPRFRGTATTLMLAMFDVGNLVGQPMIGGILEGSRLLGWSAYPVMFVTVSGILALIAVAFAIWGRAAFGRGAGHERGTRRRRAALPLPEWPVPVEQPEEGYTACNER